LAKVLVAGALLFYLIENGTLDLSRLRIVFDRPEIFAIGAGYWLIAAVVLGSLRWKILLNGVDCFVPYPKILKFHLIGFFFNVALPGAVGGDLVKAVYVIRDTPGISKVNAMMSIIIDRVVGLASLFVLAGIVFALYFSDIWAIEAAHSIVTASLIALLLGVTFFVAVLMPYPPGKDPFEKLFSLRLPGFALGAKVYGAMRLYQKKPYALLSGLFLSIAIQSLNLGQLWYLTGAMMGQMPEFSRVAMVAPLGNLASALPISPGGFGVGHVAFERLYKLVGLTDGANIYNVFLLIGYGFNLLGIIPYLMHRSKAGVNVRQISATELGSVP
jgi:uncharacterized membrane protein YbhN (UPF0104 family)